MAFLLQGGLGLPDREDYLSPDSAKVSLRAGYREYIGRLLALAGFGHADQRARAVLALETALARTQASARRRPTTTTPTTCGRGPTSRAEPRGWTGPPSSTRRVWRSRGRSACGSPPRSPGWRRWSRPSRSPAGRTTCAFMSSTTTPTCCRAPSPRRARRSGRRRPAARRRLATGPARARGDPGGHGRRRGQAVRRAVLPAGAEGPGPGHRRQRHRGLPEAGRGGDVDVARDPGDGAGQARRRCTSASGTRSGGRTIPTWS